MQMTFRALAVIGLRVVTLMWPLATEALAMLWWARVQGPSRLPTLLIVAAYFGLVFAPSRILFSWWGMASVMLLLSASLLLLLRYWSEPSGVPGMIWIHLGFAIAWLIILGARKFKRTPS